jgi:hypothetical protein
MSTMAHRHVICDEGYTIIRCRCPGGITAVVSCPGVSPSHTHTNLRWVAEVGPAILIKDEDHGNPD